MSIIMDLHVSLDIETLSTRADAVVLSIAAAANYVDGHHPSDTFSMYCCIDQHDRHIDPNTQLWWQTKQSHLWPVMQERTSPEQALPLKNVLQELQQWLFELGTNEDRLFIWGNGSSFDVSILEHAYKTAGQQPPWAFWTVRDIRTLKHLAEEKGVFTKPVRDGCHHEALSDAIYQLDVVLLNWPRVTT